MSASPHVLQKSKIAEALIFRENKKRDVITHPEETRFPRAQHIGECEVFDPVSVLLAAKSGLGPSAYGVLRPDPAYFERQRIGRGLGKVAAVFFAIGWFVLLPTTGTVAFFFPNPLARACVYLLYWSITLASLAEIFVFEPRRLKRQRRQVLKLTPDGLVQADWEQS
jgi:hypothetical protein